MKRTLAALLLSLLLCGGAFSASVNDLLAYQHDGTEYVPTNVSAVNSGVFGLDGSGVMGFRTTISGMVSISSTTFVGALTGNASTATTFATSRSIYGNSFNGSADLTQIITSTYGGTGNGFTKFTGPTTTERTKTLRDANDTILELGGNYTPTGTWTGMTLVTPALGTPASGLLTNCTGLPTGGLVDNAVTNAKLAQMAQATVKGRAAAAGTGDPSDLTANQLSTLLDSATDPFLRTSAGGGDMLKSIYDPQNAGHISGASGAGGAAGGELELDAGSGATAVGGYIDLVGGSGSDAAGGYWLARGGSGTGGIAGYIEQDANGTHPGGYIKQNASSTKAGGWITMIGAAAEAGYINMDGGSVGAAGSIDMNGSSGGAGGSIYLPGGPGADGGGLSSSGGSSSGARGGDLSMDGGTSTNARGGDIRTQGGTASSSVGGDIDTHGGVASGGKIDTHGGSQSSAAGGAITTKGGSATSSFGGEVKTYGGSAATTYGGAVQTYGGTSSGAHGGTLAMQGGTSPGGDILTANGGGSIDTTAGGSITTGTGNLTGGSTSGTIALTSDILTKAWVVFDGSSASTVACTYSRTGTTVTVSSTSHGHIVGHVIYASITSGGAASGVYTITGVTTNTYTFTTVASGTIAAGSTMNELRRTISASSGVHSVTYRNSAGLYAVNFSTAMVDANYAITTGASTSGATDNGNMQVTTGTSTLVPTAQAFYITTSVNDTTPIDSVRVSAVITR